MEFNRWRVSPSACSVSVLLYSPYALSSLLDVDTLDCWFVKATVNDWIYIKMNKTLVLQAFISFLFICMELGQEKTIQNDSETLFCLHNLWTSCRFFPDCFFFFFFIKYVSKLISHWLYYKSWWCLTQVKCQNKDTNIFSIRTKGLGMHKYHTPKPLYF